MRFTFRRDPCGRLSACADGPSGRDVHCRVHVRVRLMPAGDAPEDRLALAVLRCAIPTHTAGLRRIRRIHLLNPSQCLVLQPPYQGAPTIGQNPAVQPRLGAAAVRQVAAGPVRIGLRPRPSGHSADAKVLDDDEVEPPREITACLLDPILAAISGSGVQLGNCRLETLSSVGTASAPGQATLQTSQSCLFRLRQAGAGQQFAGGQRCRHGHTTVHPDDLSGSWFRDRRGDRGKGDVPAPRSVASDAVRLRRRLCTRQTEPYPADLGNVHHCPFSALLDDPGCLDTDDAEAFVLPGLPPGRSPVGTSPDISESPVEVSQRLLLHRVRPRAEPVELCSCRGQLPALVGEAWCRLLVRSPHRRLLERQVPYVPRMSAVIEQRVLLRGSRVHPKPGHAAYPTSQHRQSPFSQEGDMQ